MSRASLFEAEGLAQNQVAAIWTGSHFMARVEYMTVVSPGASESTVRLEASELATRSVSLGLRLERLDFRAEESEGWGGWSLGAIGRGTWGRRLESWVGVDRMLRGKALRRAGIPGSLECGAAVRAGAARLAVLDRWDPDGAETPRIVVEVPIGSAGRLVLGRGSSPSPCA